jgi:hypothetical protein
MRASMCAIVLVLCACKSGSGNGSDNSPLMHEGTEFTRLETSSGVIQIDWQHQRTYDETNLLVDVDKAWAAVPTVYGELGIQPSVIDSKQHVYGNAGANIRRSIGNQRMSRYFDCGATAGIANADSYDMLVRVLTQIVPTEGGLSKLRTQAEATAHANAVSGAPVRCSSTGALEARIAQMVSEQAVRAAK